MSEHLLELLETANREVPRFLKLAATLVENPSGPVELKKLSDRLGQIGKQFAVNSANQPQDSATQAALAEYRKHLENLFPALQGLRGSLLARRARLEAQSSHLRAARLWAAGYHQTL